MVDHRKAFFILIIQLVLNYARANGVRKTICICDGKLTEFDVELLVNSRGHLNCEEVCRRKKDCFNGSCDNGEKAISTKCKDESDGKSYEIGQAWRKNCKIFTCAANSRITHQDVSCPQICVNYRSREHECCPICTRKLTCSQKEIVVEIPRPMLRGTDPSRLTLSDKSCRAIANSTHVIIKTGLASCKTTFRRTKDGFIYSNFVQKAFTRSALIIRPWFKFACLFAETQLKTSSVDLPSFNVRLAADNRNNDLAMFYTNADGDVRIDVKKHVIQEGHPVYVVVVAKGASNESQFVALEQCSIVSAAQKKTRDLILKGCPVEGSLKIHEKLYNKVWFSFKALKLYAHEKNYIDLNCQATVCSKTSVFEVCNRQC